MTPKSPAWLQALKAQLDLIKWWRSEPGLAYGTFLTGGSSLFDQEARDAANFAAAVFEAAKDDTGFDTGKLVANIPRYKAQMMKGATLAGDCAGLLGTSTTYWVSPEMSRFIFHAHEDIPTHPLQTSDLLDARGFVYFAEPLKFETAADQIMSIGAISWNLYEAASPQTVDILAYEASKADGSLRPTGGVVAAGAIGEIPAASSLSRLLQAFWLLSAQRIARTASQPVDRNFRKRAARSKYTIPEDGIQVVTLRRLSEDNPTPPDHAPQLVEWSHRWIVSRHQRNQWYPASKEHRLKWIEAYVKGPESAPLVMKDRVYRVIR